MRILKVLTVTSLILVAFMGITQQVQAGEIVVTGQGRVDQSPDMAVISLGVQHQAPTARNAMDTVSKATADMLKRLKSNGIHARDIQTSDLSMHPVWDHNATRNNEQRVIGFVANNRVLVRVRDLDLLSKVLDDVINDGANQFSGLSFALQDPKPALDEARRRAVADARAKAELYALAAGVDLGAILSLSEANAHRREPMYMEAAAMRSDAGVPVSAGEVSTEAQVTIVFEIAQ